MSTTGSVKRPPRSRCASTRMAPSTRRWTTRPSAKTKSIHSSAATRGSGISSCSPSAPKRCHAHVRASNRQTVPFSPRCKRTEPRRPPERRSELHNDSGTAPGSSSRWRTISNRKRGARLGRASRSRRVHANHESLRWISTAASAVVSANAALASSSPGSPSNPVCACDNTAATADSAHETANARR